MDLNTDFSYMANEELDELISRIKEAKERRSESERLISGIMSGEP